MVVEEILYHPEKPADCHVDVEFFPHLATKASHRCLANLEPPAQERPEVVVAASMEKDTIIVNRYARHPTHEYRAVVSQLGMSHRDSPAR